jgi:hypothetical protein
MEQRRTRRFTLQLPLSVTRVGAERVTFPGCTQNISSSGVLFTTERKPDLGGPIEYIITMNLEGAPSVNLRCIGKVLRADLVLSDSDQQLPAFQIAATLERYEFVRERFATGAGEAAKS